MEITFDNGLRYAVSRSLVKLMEIGTVGPGLTVT